MEEGLRRTLLVVYPLLCSRKEKHTLIMETLYIFPLQRRYTIFRGFQ
jgi:hypothetical protein